MHSILWKNKSIYTTAAVVFQSHLSVDDVEDSCLGKRIELVFRPLVNVVAMLVKASTLRRRADCRRGFGNGSAVTKGFPVAFARDLVNGGSIRLIENLFNPE